jgi:hypothetical protein
MRMRTRAYVVSFMWYLHNPTDFREFVKSDQRCRMSKIGLILFLYVVSYNILPSADYVNRPL